MPCNNYREMRVISHITVLPMANEVINEGHKPNNPCKETRDHWSTTVRMLQGAFGLRKESLIKVSMVVKHVVGAVLRHALIFFPKVKL